VGGGPGAGIMLTYLAEPEGPEGAIWFEFGIERSEHEDDASRAAEFLKAMVGFRWADRWSARLEPYLALGASYSQLRVSGGSELSGGGLYCGAGIELLLARAAFGSAEARFHTFWEDSASGGSAFSAALAAGLGLRF